MASCELRVKSMTDNQIEAVIGDRFGRRTRHLRDAHATPLFTLGLNVDRSEFVLCTLEEVPDEQVVQMLESALALMRRKHRDYRPKRP